MSLLSSPTGHLTNLSTAPASGFAPADDSVFRDRFHDGWVVATEPENGVEFLADGRFRMTDGTGSREGDYTYARTGRHKATVVLDFDDGDRCTYRVDNGGAAGIAYADGHLFVVDIFKHKVFAYTTVGERDAALDFDLAEDNSRPLGIAYGGGSFYVADEERVFVYTVDGATAGGPDLVVDVPAADRRVGAGASFTFEASVRNQGVGSADATTLRYYRSADSTITTDDTTVGSAAVAVLGAAASSRHAVEIQAPADSGTYYYGACVDATEGESDATNNCSAGVRVEVAGNGGPDLVVEDPLGGPGAWARHRFTLNATVRNRGDGRAAATVLRYYRSEDQTITTSDAEVGTTRVQELAAGASAEYPIRILAPAEPGRYHYGACVDAPAGEGDGGNNCSLALAVEVSARVEGCAFGLDEDNDDPAGIAHVNGVLYVPNDGFDRKVFAYALSGERDADSDVDLGDDVRSPHRVVAVDDRLYVLDDAYDRVRVYATSGGRVAGDDFDLDEGNRSPAGIAHADGTFYVADAFAGREVFAYSASNLTTTRNTRSASVPCMRKATATGRRRCRERRAPISRRLTSARTGTGSVRNGSVRRSATTACWHRGGAGTRSLA